jgi:hypothetical protein
LDLVNGSNPKFDQLRDQLLHESNANPIYASSFAEYYQAFYGVGPTTRIEFIIRSGETPVLLFLLHEYSSLGMESPSYSYFGLPGLVALNLNIDRAIQDLAVDQAFHQLREIGLLKAIKNNPFEIVFPDLFARNSAIIESFAKQSSSGFMFFERVIDLRKSKEELVNEFAKSAKVAIKSDTSKDQTFKFVTRESAPEERKSAVSELKELHHQSAGRQTRSNETWDLQELQLADGSLTLGIGYRNEIIVHGAMYMVANSSAFYAVSANSKEALGTSIAHPFVCRSIFALKSMGIEKLYMGRQYEELTRELPDKERNIAKFKSFFGGELILGFGLRNA